MKKKKHPKQQSSRRVRTLMYTQDFDHMQANNLKCIQSEGKKLNISVFKKILIEEAKSKDGKLDWAFIVHNKDTHDDGEKVRKHVHVVLSYENPQTAKHVAQLFKDKPEYVELWKGSVNNAYSYLLHETTNARNKFHYDVSEVISSFDFKSKIESIRKKAKKISRKDIQNYIVDYSNEMLTKQELEEKIGVLEMAKNKLLIDRIESILAHKKHKKFLKEFKGQKCITYWIWGISGSGKTRTVREVLEKMHPNDFCILGSQRDHFQEYQGEGFIVINDLRPTDYEYGQLLTLLDPWEIDKMAPARYHDKYLNARAIYITTPYDPFSFYQECNIANQTVDSFDQLNRRIISLHLTKDNRKKLKDDLITDDKLSEAIWKLKSQKNTSHADSDKSND